MTTISRTPTPSPSSQPASDPLQLIDVDHVRFYVGNAKQAAFFYAQAYGFQIDQVSDLTTGNREEADYLLTQGNIRFILTTGLNKDHPASRHISLYGDGVKDVAFTVHSCEAAYKQAMKNGGTSRLRAPGVQGRERQRSSPQASRPTARSSTPSSSGAAAMPCPPSRRALCLPPATGAWKTFRSTSTTRKTRAG